MIHGCIHHDYEDISINHCFDLLNQPHNIHGPGAGSKEVGLVLHGTLEDAGPDASHLDHEDHDVADHVDHDVGEDDHHSQQSFS